MSLLRTFGGLWVENDDASRRHGVRPRRLALLALLASAGVKGRSREQILAILWPESPPGRARASLSQALYNLESDLGGAEVVIATSAQLRLDESRLTSDVEGFRRAVAAKDWNRAATLYNGPFLDGFYLNDAPEFERWVDEERATLARDGRRAIERVACAANERKDAEAAAAQWQRLARLDPLNSAYALALMQALATRGDRAAALAHGQEHAAHVREELETDPDPEVSRFLVALRESGSKLPEITISDLQEELSLPPPAAPEPAEVPPTATSRTTPHSWWLKWAAVGILLALAALVWRLVRRPAESDAPVLAVGQVRDLVSPDSVQLRGVLSEMLATSIGRLTQLQVIANSRLLELIPQGRETVRSARTDAARRAGASDVLEGELMPIDASRLRFALRRLDIRRGIVRAGYQIEGNDRLALFDSVAVLIATDLGIAPPAQSLAEASTRSPLAYRLYEEGLRAFTQFDAGLTAAHRLFSAAMREDSSFAMAVYYRWRSEVALGLSEQHATLDRALALAPRAADRDRLLILTHIRSTRSDLNAVAVAESLIARYPNDPEALIRASEAMLDAERAVAVLNRAIALDSAAGAASAPNCRLCDAFIALMWRYAWADSTAAVELAARRWAALRPNDSAPWSLLADHLVGVGRRREAEAAYQRALALGADRGDEDMRRLDWDLRSDDLAAANAACRRGLDAGVESFLHYRWNCTILRRIEGRHREAMELVRHPPVDVVNAAIVALSLGQPQVAARRFLSLARVRAAEHERSPGLQARNVAWNLTLAGTAFAAAGDTARVRQLVDSVEMLGRRSLFQRDRLLHHFLRGLLYAAAARHDSAVAAFRAALSSQAFGYTRINYELAKSLLAQGRALEAIPILRATLRGGLAGSGLYLTRTEAHELLAKAFDAAGKTDSAVAHYAIVERAWRTADPPLKPRYEAARARLAALGAPRAVRASAEVKSAVSRPSRSARQHAHHPCRLHVSPESWPLSTPTFEA